MVQRMLLGLFVALAPSVALAQGKLENYLPTKSQLYFHWDGMEMHRADYDKTAVGKMMQGETGKFLDELWVYIHENLQTAAQNEPKVGPLLRDFTKLVGGMYKDGLAFGVSVDKINLPNVPNVQAVLAFPKAAGESGTLIPLIQKIAEETRAKVNTTKVGNRFVNTVTVEVLQIGWWAQGADAILFLGTTDPVAYAKDIDAKKTGLASNALYQRVAGFKEFKTNTRGYFDFGGALDIVNDIHPLAPKIIDETGLRGLKSLTFVSGFDGPGERSIVDVDIPGKREGLLSLTSTRKISLKDLPVLPSDIRGFSASSISLNKSYDVLVKLVEGVAGAVAPDAADTIKEGIKAFQGAVGVDINKDIFGTFGDVLVSYNSPSDGFFGTGAVVAIQVKDGKKLIASIDKLVKAIPQNPAGEVSLKRKAYRGGEIIQVQMSGQANVHLATFGLYKDWFVYSSYPTPIKGFIMRQEGVLPAWKADASLTKVLAQFPSEFNSIQVSDPRPTVQTLLSIAPLALNLANSFGGSPFLFPGYRPFDLELIPHAQEATMHLFPNVTIGTDDGKRVRSETRGSLVLPF
jgi:hypothetical protein